jgi:hypothetical protein
MIEEDTPSEIDSAVSRISELAGNAYLIVFCGKHHGCTRPPPSTNKECCVFTEPTLETITSIFTKIQEIQTSTNNTDAVPLALDSIRGLHFVGYSFPHLPDNIGHVFTNVKLCSFMSCGKLASLSTTVRQFPSLSSLSVIDCPALASLSSLSAVPEDINLQALRFNNCKNLRVTELDDWGDAMRALGKTSSAVLVLNITSCQNLRCIPPSISHLKNILSCLRLESNDNLSILPQELGELKSLAEFQLINCPCITSLPPSMCRLDDYCNVSITNNNNLIHKIFVDSKEEDEDGGRNGYDMDELSCYRLQTAESKACMFYYSRKIILMDRYFKRCRMRNLRGVVRLSTLFRRARYRAVDRIYRPGGEGFIRCRKRFSDMSQIEVDRNGIDLGGTLDGMDLHGLVGDELDAARAGGMFNE